jgi:hypothetical protein
MTLLADPLSSTAFATPHAGEDYFATEAHYLSLAGRLVAALRRGAVFVFLTGDPPPDALLLTRALESAAAWWYAVIVMARDPEINRERLMRDSPRFAIPDDSRWGSQAAEPTSPLSPLFVFDAGDGFSAEQVENLYQSLLHREGVGWAGVLLTRNSSLARLEQSRPRLIEDGRIARFHLQELGRDEIKTFIRRQRYPGYEPTAFTTEAITAIADISCGDPALVNHLARVTLEFNALVHTKEDEQRIAGVEAVHTALANTVEPRGGTKATAGRRPSVSAHRRRSARRVQIGLLLVLAIAGILAVPSGGLLSIAERAAQNLPVIRWADLGASINSRRVQASRTEIGDISQQGDSAAQTIAADQVPQSPAPAVSMAAIPGHPTSEPADASSTSEAAASQSPSPKDQAGMAPGHAPAAIAVPLVEMSSAAPTLATPASLQPPAAQADLSHSDVVALVARGDAFVGAGDISSARLLYERAAEAGDGRAALRMGATFDPAFINQANISNAFADQRQALSWYRRARDLGQAEAERRLNEAKLN